MYLDFFGLKEKPFSQTPDPRFLYWNDSYREALASLRYGIQERKGFLTFIGEAGTGKTTLLRKLLEELGPDVLSVFLFNPDVGFEEILQYTLGELGISCPSQRRLDMLQRLAGKACELVEECAALHDIEHSDCAFAEQNEG